MIEEKPSAIIRRHPDDFVVEELPAYAASGEGEHLFVTFTKTSMTTLDAVRRIAKALGADERSAGFAGMKDKHAVTTQTVSLAWPRERAPAEATALEIDGIRVLSAARHPHKLKPGHLKGNRFTIVLRDLPEDRLPEVELALSHLGVHGFPNAFGPQRFGHGGDNASRALAWLAGQAKEPRDKRLRRLLFSSLQAHLFNEVLLRRREDETWDVPLEGDLLKKSDTGGLFLSTHPTEDRERAARGDVSPTGPIYGAKMRWSEGKPAEIEREILSRACGGEVFERWRSLGEGSRRSLRMFASELGVTRIREHPGALRVHFVLPKGGYATTILACAVTLQREVLQEEEMAAE